VPVALVVAALAASFRPDVVAALSTAKQIYVATRRADGTESKVVPVWFMLDGDAIYFTTGPDSYKARRIARGSPLLVWVGSPQGPHFVGQAELVRDPEVGAHGTGVRPEVLDRLARPLPPEPRSSPRRQDGHRQGYLQAIRRRTGTASYRVTTCRRAGS